MRVQRLVMPGSGDESWTVVDDALVPVEPVERFLAHLSAIERSPGTVRAYAHSLALWWRFLAMRAAAWDSAGVEDVSEFVRWLRAPADNVVVLDASAAVSSAATVNRHLAAVFAFYDFHARAGVVLAASLVAWRSVPRGSYKLFLEHVVGGRPVPTRPVRLRTRRRLPRILTVEQVTLILAACERLRDRFLFALLAETGMRIGQGLGLRHADFVSRRCEVTIVPRLDNVNGARAKTRAETTLPVSAPLVRLYSDYMHREYGAIDSDYVFVNLWAEPVGAPLRYDAVAKLVARLRARSGVAFTPHMLRHTRASEWIRAGVPIEVVSKLLTHRSVATTSETYVHLSAADVRAELVRRCVGRPGRGDAGGWAVSASLAPVPGEADGSLLARLEAAVRLEFRVDAYRPDADDPVLGGECAVAGCDGLPRTRGLCNAHHIRWRQAGRPEMDAFVVTAPPQRRLGGRKDCFDLSGLGGQLRLELAYALQCRHDERAGQLSPYTFTQVARLAVGSGLDSLLALPLPEWFARLPGSERSTRAPRAFLRYARRMVEELAVGSDPEQVYASDVWDAARLGLAVRVGTRVRLRFDNIEPAWLREAAKRWVRFRLAGGKSFVTARAAVGALSAFAAFLTARGMALPGPSAITRPLLDDYLSWLAGEHLSVPARRGSIGGLRTFLDHCRRHDWLPGLPASATLYPDDYPRLGEALPRFVPEFIMAQLEAPESLARLADPSLRRLVVVLIETGLRITDACCLPFNPLVDDSVGWPCLRFHNTKMSAEQLIPLSAAAAAAIRAQQDHVLARWPAGSPWLFPRSRANPDGAQPVAASTVRSRLAAWQGAIDLRDEAGQPVRVTPHQFRHTVGTRMINQGVPQHVIQRLLGHKSPRMTARYAHVHDATVRAAFDDYQRRRVDITGARLDFDPTAPTADAEWVKHNLARVAASLPNGYCGRPPQQDCPHPNACLTCPDFQTTPAFLPIHRRQRDGTLELIDAAERAGNQRLAGNHRQVHTTLDRVITALEAIDAEEPADAAG